MSYDSDNSEGSALLGQLEYLEGLVRRLKRAAIDGGDGAVSAASSVLDGEDELTNAIVELHYYARERAEESHYELATLLEEYDDRDADDFWAHFRGKLAVLEPTGTIFRRSCLHRTIDIDEDEPSTLLHELCKKNPPADIVETLIEKLIPPHINPHDGELCVSQFNHLACVNGASGREYPLHTVMRHGGSIDLVKLLIKADAEKITLRTMNKHTCDENRALLDLLIDNREQHRPNDYSRILRHLALSYSTQSSPLLHESSGKRGMPLEVLWDNLKGGGCSNIDVLKNEDFVFLLKATCFHHHSSRRGADPLAGYDETLEEIERISLAHAFLVCSPCFDMGAIKEVLPYLFSIDSSFLLEKDMNGKYPVHEIIRVSHPSDPRGYCLPSSTTGRHFGQFEKCMVKQVLETAPQCARIADDKGRLPLHIAADIKSTDFLPDDCRLILVNSILKAFPDANGIADNKTGLPPFALSLRRGVEAKWEWEKSEASLSTAFFLLKSRPDVLSGCLANGKKISSEVACTSSVKRRKMQDE